MAHSIFRKSKGCLALQSVGRAARPCVCVGGVGGEPTKVGGVGWGGVSVVWRAGRLSKAWAVLNDYEQFQLMRHRQLHTDGGTDKE